MAAQFTRMGPYATPRAAARQRTIRPLRLRQERSDTPPPLIREAKQAPSSWGSTRRGRAGGFQRGPTRRRRRDFQRLRNLRAKEILRSLSGAPHVRGSICTALYRAETGYDILSYQGES